MNIVSPVLASSEMKKWLVVLEKETDIKWLTGEKPTEFTPAATHYQIILRSESTSDNRLTLVYNNYPPYTATVKTPREMIGSIKAGNIMEGMDITI